MRKTTTARARCRPVRSWRCHLAYSRASIALALLISLLTVGVAHASRLCGLSGHREAAPTGVAHCSAEHRQHAATAEHRSERPAERSGHARGACCAGGAGLATIPAAKVQGATWTTRSVSVAGDLALLAASTTVARTLVATSHPWSARDPGSGLRHHLVQRVLLI